MAEHLHGYPPCEAMAGKPCPPSDLNYAECKPQGVLQSCAPSVVDGMPTGQYRCMHRDAMPAARSKAAKKKPAAKKAKPAKKKARPAKKAARKGARAKPKKATRKSKPKKAARKAKPAKKAKSRKAGKKKK